MSFVDEVRRKRRRKVAVDGFGVSDGGFRRDCGKGGGDQDEAIVGVCSGFRRWSSPENGQRGAVLVVAGGSAGVWSGKIEEVESKVSPEFGGSLTVGSPAITQEVVVAGGLAFFGEVSPGKVGKRKSKKWGVFFLVIACNFAGQIAGGKERDWWI